jgi:uncharacterized membrane protein
VQQLVWTNFLPVFVPAWPSWLYPAGSACIAGVLLILTGIAFIFQKKPRKIALIFGGILLALVVCWHTPHQIFFNPFSKYLATWAHALKCLALAGGSFAVANLFSSDDTGKSRAIELLEKVIPAGRIFFSATMILFGVVHFLYPKNVATLVPSWIPWSVFWTYFAAVALIGSGIAIILKIKLKPVGMLLGVMIFIWFVILHIPRAIADPVTGMGNEVTSMFQALGFSGIAFMLMHDKK